ncbi:MAG TPA: SUF system NifU family Fe-S cluster assembly protein [Kofleriaceae bacterium]|nr:SUF system NifU family Fe-S cluster assembly protein [Kofleriaceae bacterium]
MNEELRDLYQEFILDHGRRPRNKHALDHANRGGEGYNPLCGDRLTLQLEVKDGVIVDAGFTGSGCAISTASASTMTEAVKGKTVAEAEKLFHEFHTLVTTGGPADEDLLGNLAVFGGVSEFPMRVKCATLAWHTLQHALADDGKTATTE